MLLCAFFNLLLSMPFVSLLSIFWSIVYIILLCYYLLATIVLNLAVLKTGAVNSASGSAYAEFGNTKVIVSV